VNTMKLENAIQQACKDLDWIHEAVAKVRSSGTLSEESYKFFEMSFGLSTQLAHAKDLLLVRDIAFAAVKALPASVSRSSPNRFLLNGAEVTFKQGRYLLFQNYLATTWALYDAISKVAGILCCIDERSKNITKPVKLPEDFLRGQKFVGGRVHDHLKGAYGWPIGISYAIRNWLIHDGHSQNGIELFKFDASSPSPFEISDGAWSIIMEKCTAEYKADSSQTRLRPFPEIHLDLLEGMAKCHQEADEAIEFVLLWAAGAVKLQATILFPRDVLSTPVASLKVTA
jgi:hypothetical protein